MYTPSGNVTLLVPIVTEPVSAKFSLTNRPVTGALDVPCVAQINKPSTVSGTTGSIYSVADVTRAAEKTLNLVGNANPGIEGVAGTEYVLVKAKVLFK